MGQKRFGIEMNIIVETDLDVMEFGKKFIEWVEFNGWESGGTFKSVDKDGNVIKKEK